MLPPLVLALPFLGTSPAGDPWDRFRGPGGAGVAAGEAPLPALLDREGSRAWTSEVPPGHSSPCVSGERIFLTGHGEGELVTLCVERAQGRVLWSKSVAVEALERTHETNGPASPTPTTDGKHVVVYFGSFGLLGYDLEGRELWRRELPTPENTFGTAASPVIAGGKLIFVSDANDSSWLEALDPATGETLWKRERTGFGSGWSTPGMWTSGGTEELLVYGVWWLTGYDLADGSERWSFPGLSDEPITTPVAGEGLVFVTSYNMKTNPEVMGLPSFTDLLVEHDHDGDGTLDAVEAKENASVLSRPDADGEGDHPLSMFFRFLDVDKNGEIDGQEWQKLVGWVDGFRHANAVLAIRPGATGRGSEIAWQFPRGVPECPSPLYYRGRLYLVMNGGLVTCLDARTGEQRFQGRLGARGPYYASPVAGDGKVYAASARGELTVIQAGDALEVLSSVDLGERLMATPALSDGVLFVRTERRLHAFR